MPNPRLAGRYAKSLKDLAIEQGQLETVYADMSYLKAVCKSNADFVALMRSPVIKGDQKNKIIEAVTTGKVSALTAQFNRLLVNKGRENYLPEIVTAFIEQYKELKGIHTVKLTTAVPVSEEVKQGIINQLQTSTPMKNVELEAVVKEDIIGGFVLEAGDRLIDASIAYDLREVRKQFLNNDFIYKIR